MSRLGLRIATDGKPISSRQFQFDTEKEHLQVDLNHTPKFADLLDTPKLTLYANGSVGKYETLLTIAHGLTFIPKCSAFFYIYDEPATMPDTRMLSQYAGDLALISGGAAYSDIVYWTVDDTNFYIKHYFDDSGGWLSAVGQTAQTDQVKMRIKYFIYNNPGRKPRWSFDG